MKTTLRELIETHERITALNDNNTSLVLVKEVLTPMPESGELGKLIFLYRDDWSDFGTYFSPEYYRADLQQVVDLREDNSAEVRCREVRLTRTNEIIPVDDQEKLYITLFFENKRSEPRLAETLDKQLCEVGLELRRASVAATAYINSLKDEIFKCKKPELAEKIEIADQSVKIMAKALEQLKSINNQR